jgi:hypothetical protein
MTEPIKPPPLPAPPIHLSGWTNELCEWAKDYARLAVEQATAEMRRDIARSKNDVEQMQHEINMLASRAVKAEAEREKARTENAALLAQVNAFYLGTPDSRLLAMTKERDEAHAELDRLTTLRPMGHPYGGNRAAWIKSIDGGYVPANPVIATHWTPLPDVKEAKP